MPSINKHATPNFSQNEIKGWATRIIYSLYNSPFAEIFTVNDFGSNVFELIQSGTANLKGTYRFGSNTNRFFKTGKNFRIKARFLVTTVPESGGVIFNIRVGMVNSFSGLTIVSSTNNGNNHIPSNQLTNCPVDFEVIFTIAEENSVPNLYCQANGNYIYDYNFYNSGTKNTSLCFVPVWNSTPFQLIGSNIVENSFYLDFFGSADLQNLRILYLFIEELT